MGAFDLGYVDEAGGTSDECAAREVELGDGLETTFVEDTTTVRDPFPAFE